MREHIDSAMLEEALVLRREHRVDHVRRDFCHRDFAREPLIHAHFPQRHAVPIGELEALHRWPQQRGRQRHELQPQPREEQPQSGRAEDVAPGFPARC